MAFLFDEQRRLIRKDGSLVERPKTRRGPRSTELCGRVSHLRVDMILGGPGELREAYEKLLDNPATLLKNLQAWFLERGHKVTLSAINRHRRRYFQQFVTEYNMAKSAKAFCALTRRHGPGAVAEATHARVEMLAMEKSFKMDGAPETPTSELQALARVSSANVATRRNVEAMREEIERKEKEAALARMPEENKSAMVADKVRRILGVKF